MGEAESENGNRHWRMLKRAVVFVSKRSRARCSADRYRAGFEAFCGSRRDIGSINRRKGYFVDLAGRGPADVSVELQSARHC